MLRPISLVCALALAAGAVAAVRPFALQEMEQPTKHHTELQKAVGEWEGTITMYGMPGAPEEVVSKATETTKAVGPFWVYSEFTSDIMGMPYQGSGHSGYDARAKKYVGTWVDNMSSFFSHMEGKLNEETGEVVMTWQAPTMDGEMAPHRSVSKHEGDSYTSHFYVGEGDDAPKTMTISMKRKK